MKLASKWMMGITILALVSVIFLNLDVAAQDNKTTVIQQDTASIVDETRIIKGDLASPVTSGFHRFIPRDAITNALDTAVADDVLTQVQADKILTDIETNAEEQGRTSSAETITIAHPLPHGPHGLFGALLQAVNEGTLTEGEMNQIMEEFAQQAGEGVQFNFDDDQDTHYLELNIDGPEDFLHDAAEAALNNAVAEGILTEEEAAAILETSRLPKLGSLTGISINGDMPDIDFDGHNLALESSLILEEELVDAHLFPHTFSSIAIHSSEDELHFGFNLADELFRQRLESALEEGILTQAEVDAVLDALSQLRETHREE